MAFYEFFEKLCKEKGMTPTQVARDNNLTQQAVSHWKTRGSTPKAETVQKLADYFGVAPAYFFGLNKGEPVNTVLMAMEMSKDNIIVRLDDKDNEEEALIYVDCADGESIATAREEAHVLIEELSDIGALKAVGYMWGLLDGGPRYRREEAPEPSPAPPEGKDTPAPPEGTEGPQKPPEGV